MKKMKSVCKFDKVTMKFLADVLYIKGIISFEEFTAIMDASTADCLDVIVETMLCEGYNNYKSARNEKEVY